MSAPSLKYFDIRGLAEPVRLVLVAAGVKFEDNRLQFTLNADGSMNTYDWPSVHKPNTPYGQVPVLTTEAGTQLAQSSAIIRYIARKYNFEGADLEQSALIDAGFEAVLDCKRSYFQNKSNEEKTKEFWSAGLLKHLQGLEKNIVGPFFAGEKLSYVDVALYYLIWQLATENREAVEAAVGQVPKVKAVYEAVPKLPQVAEYLAQRKETAF